MRIARTLAMAGTSALASLGILGVVAVPAAMANGVPAHMSSPELSGTAQAGETLVTSNGTWAGNPYEDGFTYQWQRCEDLPTALMEPVDIPLPCTDIPGATASAYTLVIADVGFLIRSAVTGHNGAGASDPAYSDLSDPVTANPPMGPAPVITGTAQVGQTLTATMGPWTGGGGPLTTVWAWARCAGLEACDAIEGANAPTYLVTDADVGMLLVARVDVTGPGGTDGAVSEPTAAVIPAPPPAPAPAPEASGPASANVSGDTITVSGSGFAPDSDVIVELRSDPVVLGVARTDATGAFSATFPLPAGVTAGAHVLAFIGYDAAGNPITIEQPITLAGVGGLPVTGSGNLALSLAAAGLILAGAVALRGSRRLASSQVR